MEAKNLAQHQASAQRLGADIHDFQQPAFHVDVRFLHARRPHQIARQRCQARSLELVYFRRELRRADIHLLRELLGHDVHHELAGSLYVAQRVFAAAFASPDRANHGRETDHRRIRAGRGEKAEWRQIQNPVRADRRDERDRPWHNRRNHQPIDVARLGSRRIDDHFFSIQLAQYSFHSTLSPAGRISKGLRPSSITALSSVNVFLP